MNVEISSIHSECSFKSEFKLLIGDSYVIEVVLLCTSISLVA